MRSVGLRILGVVLAFVLIASAVAGAQQVTLSFIDDWSGTRSQALQKILAAFNSQHPDIAVELTNISNLEEILERALIQTAGGLPPDIIAVHQRLMGGVVTQGFAADLTPFIERDQLDLSQYVQGAFNGAIFDGRYFGMPKVFEPTHVMINRTMYAEVGLPVPTGGWTLDDVAEACRRLVKANEAGETTRWCHGFAGSLTALPFVHGGRYYYEDEKRLGITEPAFVRAIEWAHEQTERGYTGRNLRRAQFQRQEFGIFFEAWLSNVNRVITSQANGVGFEVETVYFPTGDAPTPTYVTSHWWVIPAASHNREAAWTFLKFLSSSPESNAVLAEYALSPATIEGLRLVYELGYVPPGHTREQIYLPFLIPTERTVSVPSDAKFHEAAAAVNFFDRLEDEVMFGPLPVRSFLESVLPAMEAVLNQ